MINDQYTEISSFNHSFKSLQNCSDRFATNLKTKLNAPNLLAKLEIEDESISAECYGYKVEAKPKVVRSNSKRVALEYRFTVSKSSDKELEVWRFYLLQNGLLSDQIDTGAGFAAIDDPDIAQIICGSLVYGMIQSGIFDPTPNLDQSTETQPH